MGSKHANGSCYLLFEKIFFFIGTLSFLFNPENILMYLLQIQNVSQGIIHLVHQA